MFTTEASCLNMKDFSESFLPCTGRLLCITPTLAWYTPSVQCSVCVRLAFVLHLCACYAVQSCIPLCKCLYAWLTKQPYHNFEFKCSAPRLACKYFILHFLVCLSMVVHQWCFRQWWFSSLHPFQPCVTTWIHVQSPLPCLAVNGWAGLWKIGFGKIIHMRESNVEIKHYSHSTFTCFRTLEWQCRCVRSWNSGLTMVSSRLRQSTTFNESQPLHSTKKAV